MTIGDIQRSSLAVHHVQLRLYGWCGDSPSRLFPIHPLFPPHIFSGVGPLTASQLFVARPAQHPFAPPHPAIYPPSLQPRSTARALNRARILARLQRHAPSSQRWRPQFPGSKTLDMPSSNPCRSPSVMNVEPETTAWETNLCTHLEPRGGLRCTVASLYSESGGS